MTIETDAAPAMPQWPADKIEYHSISSLTPYASNPRMHSPEQIEQIVASIREWGWTIPVLVDEDSTIIAGHGRVMAAEKLGLDEIPVIVARGWSEAQKRAYVIADNQIPQNASWDLPLLRIELTELGALNFDLSKIGFDGVQLVSFMTGIPGEGSESQGGDATKLAERFGVPPFSVLNAREGWWQDRKRAWIALGIQSELGRGENLIGRSPQELFCHFTGIKYDEARKIVTDAMAEQGEAFDLQALIAKHGRRKGAPSAIPGGAGANSVYRDRANLKVDGAGRLAAGVGGLADRMAEGEGTARARFAKSGPQSNDVRGTLTHRITTDPYRAAQTKPILGGAV